MFSLSLNLFSLTFYIKKKKKDKSFKLYSIKVLFVRYYSTGHILKLHPDSKVKIALFNIFDVTVWKVQRGCLFLESWWRIRILRQDFLEFSVIISNQDFEPGSGSFQWPACAQACLRLAALTLAYLQLDLICWFEWPSSRNCIYLNILTRNPALIVGLSQICAVPLS